MDFRAINERTLIVLLIYLELMYGVKLHARLNSLIAIYEVSASAAMQALRTCRIRELEADAALYLLSDAIH